MLRLLLIPIKQEDHLAGDTHRIIAFFTMQKQSTEPWLTRHERLYECAFEEVGFSVQLPINLYCDNQATIHVASMRGLSIFKLTVILHETI